MIERDVITFRAERDCTFDNRYFRAWDGEGDFERYHAFPASMIFAVPQHFVAVGDDMEIDVEVQGLRDKFFAWAIPKLQSIDGKNTKQILEEIEAGKANFLQYGEADAPRTNEPEGGAGGEQDELAKLNMTEIKVKLDELKVQYGAADKKDVLLAKLREALAAKAAEGGAGGN